MNILVWISGIFGIAANILIYQQEKGKKLLVYKLISDFIWAFHYFTLGGYSGMAVALVGVLRETVFITQRKDGVSKIWLIIFIIIAAISAILTWKGIISILPATASILSVISFWRAKPDFTRTMSFPISFCMITYAIVYKSYTAIINELLTIFSSITAIIRNTINNKQKIQ